MNVRTSSPKISERRWRYRQEETDVRHICPTAQDFYATFGLGTTDEGIMTIDADGVALTAIQGLYELIQAQQDEIEHLKAQAEALVENMSR